MAGEVARQDGKGGWAPSLFFFFSPLLSAPSPAPTKALPPQGAALPAKKSSPRVDTSVYLAAGLVCGTSSCAPGQHAALVLPSLSLGLLSDHDKMINTEWPPAVIISDLSWVARGPTAVRETQPSLSSSGLRKCQWFSNSVMHLNHVGGGGPTLPKHRLLGLTPRVLIQQVWGGWGGGAKNLHFSPVPG